MLRSLPLRGTAARAARRRDDAARAHGPDATRADAARADGSRAGRRARDGGAPASSGAPGPSGPPAPNGPSGSPAPTGPSGPPGPSEPPKPNGPSEPTGPSGPPAPLGRFGAVLVALGALAYSVWLLELPLGAGLDPVQSYVSELAATDQPLGALFRTADLAAGLLLLTAALPALVAARRRFWAATGWAALALFGAATAADSRLPLSCAPTADTACAAREDAGLVPFTHAAHAVSSGLAMAGAVTAVVALTVAARRYGWWPPLARTGPVLVALELAATAWTLVAVAAFEAGRGHWALGAGQRAQLLLVAVWLLLLAWSLRAGRAAGTGRP